MLVPFSFAVYALFLFYHNFSFFAAFFQHHFYLQVLLGK